VEHETTARRVGLVVAVVLVVTMFATSCSSGDDGPAAPVEGNAGVIEDEGVATPGGEIIYGLEAESDGWNPSNSKWAPAGRQVARAIFDTLTAYDADSIARPNLAESLTPNADYTEWTIAIRAGVLLHNGKPVTAQVVVDNLDFLKSSVLTSAAFEPVDSFAAISELELVARMKRPWVNYPYALTTQIGVVADPDWLRSGEKTNPVGTGPFAFERWIPDNELVVTRNADYWRFDEDGARFPYLDQITFRPLPDSDSRGASLDAGNIDIMQTSTALQIKAYNEASEEGDVQVFSDVSGETSEVFVQLNTMAPPFDDPDARRALALATDADAYVDTMTDGLYEVATGPFPPSSPWYVETDYPEHDLGEARALVDEVKDRNGGEFTFKILGGTSATGLVGLQLLQQQWRSAGIDAQIDPVEQAQLITRVATGDYQATLWRQFESPHPLGDSIWWHPNTATPIPEIALNFARNRNEAIGVALDSARQTTDPATEKRLYQEVQELMNADIPYVWLYHEQISVVADNNLVNVVNYTLPGGEKGLELQEGSHPMWQIWLRR
jgi:peptide/nickel transport system substrate-binding protein